MRPGPIIGFICLGWIVERAASYVIISPDRLRRNQTRHEKATEREAKKHTN